MINYDSQLQEDNTANDLLALTATGKLVSVDKTTLGGGGGGASDLDDLTDVVITAPSEGQVLKYVGAQWINTQEEASTVETGTAPTEVGIVINDTFPGVTLNNTIWNGGLPTGATVNNSLIVTSGLSDWTRYIQLQKTTSYEKSEITIDFTVNSKNAGDGFGIHMSSPLLLYNSVLYMKVNLSNDSNSGRVSFGYTTAANELGYSQPCSFSIGDNMRLRIRRTPWKTTILLDNLTNVNVPTAYGTFSFANWGTEGKYRLTFLGGAQTFTNYKYTCRETNYQSTSGVIFAGDSLTSGSGASTVDRRWTNILMKSQQHKFTNVGIGSWLIGTWNNELRNEVLPAVNGKYLVMGFGYNDVAQLTDLATFESRYDDAVVYAQGLGYTVILVSIIPNNGSPLVTPYNTRIQNVATARSCKYIDVWTPLQVGGVINPEYLFDGVHLNDAGYQVWGDTVFSNAPELYTDILADIDNTPVIAYNLPVGLETHDLLVIDPFSVVHRVSRQQWLNNGYIRLQPTLFETQTGSFAISGSFITGNNSSWQQKSNTGLRIGFNNGVAALDYLGSNVEITNAGYNGVGAPQAWSTMTGGKNWRLHATFTKGSATTTFAGSNNFLVNSGSAPNEDSNICILGGPDGNFTGRRGIYLGEGSGAGITSGLGLNVHLIAADDGGPSYTSSLSNTILIGNSLSWSEGVSNGDIIFGLKLIVPTNFWFGGKAHGYVPVMNCASNVYLADHKADDWLWRTPKSTGAAASGDFVIQGSQPIASGTTKQSTYADMFRVGSAGIRTIQPSGAGAGDWKLGKLITAAVTADTTRYIEVMVDGVVYKVIIST